MLLLEELEREIAPVLPAADDDELEVEMLREDDNIRFVCLI